MVKYLHIVFFLVAFQSFSQVPSPMEQKHRTILFQHGHAHIGNGEYIDNSSVGIKNGKILFVRNALTNDIEKTEWDTIIDISGHHIYPGFISTNNTLGLTEIDNVRATRDFEETGSINPNVRALIGFNMDSEIIYTVRTNGVLVTQATPRGGLISGTSSVMSLDGWNWEDAVYKADDGVHINWPKKMTTTGWWAEPGPSKKNDKYAKTKMEIWDFFKQAESYVKINKHDETNLKMKALRGVFKGTQRLFIHADFAPEINDVIDFSREFNFKYPVIVGGYDAHMLSDRIKENHFSVIIGKPHSLPQFEDDHIQAYFELAYNLQSKGILFCISNEGDMEAMNTRNLPFLAGTAWAYGLSEEQAVAAISLNAAKILGLDDRIGSLEKGKDATLFVSKGNALDMRSNEGVIGMIKGRFIVMDNHQMELYRKYKGRYDLKGLE